MGRIRTGASPRRHGHGFKNRHESYLNRVLMYYLRSAALIECQLYLGLPLPLSLPRGTVADPTFSSCAFSAWPNIV